MTPPNTVVLITGANRGIGLALLRLYLAQPNYTVVAAIRKVKATIEARAGAGSKLLVVKIDSTVQEDAKEAIKELGSVHGIQSIDIVIANAGISLCFPKVRDLNTQDLQEHMVSNVYGVVWLYQATRALLEKSSDGKFATIGSMAGFLETQPPYFSAAYGPSKTAVNWMTKRMDGEEEKITAFVLDPGFVDTDMARKGAEILGVSMEGLGALTPEESATGIKAVVDGATKGQTGGQMWNHKGERVAW